jgi:hypothetical protein
MIDSRARTVGARSHSSWPACLAHAGNNLC